MADKTKEEIAAEKERVALVRDREEAEAAAAKRGAGPVANKARLDEQFQARQDAEAAKADEGSSRPMVDERLTPAEQKKAEREAEKGDG